MSIVVENVSFQSEGNRLRGRLYRPAPDGKYPAVAICHGYPGDTKNIDLAEELALNSIVVLIFYYQGAWGSKGVYRFARLDLSTRDAVSYLRSMPYVDPSRIGLVSHSMGALPLVKRLSIDSTIKTAAMMAPVCDISLWTGEDDIETVIPQFLESAKGKLEGITSDQLRIDLHEVTEMGNPIDLINDIQVPILLIVGADDEVAPPELCKALFDKAKEPKKWVLIDKADHSFSLHRHQTIHAVLDWLKVTL